MKTLQAFFQEHQRAALAFSGGADSAFLLWAAREYGCDIQPYYVKTVFQPEFEYQDAKRLARELGILLTVIEVDILQVTKARENGPRRCYYCKKAIFESIWNQARQDGHTVLLDGTNASDEVADRPGMKALEELLVRSPLRECGISKEELRKLSKKAGLFTWNKPAYACLATRIMTGVPIEAEQLSRVEQAESVLSEMGFTDFRVRVLGDAARIQVLAEQMERAAGLHAEIVRKLKPAFSAVLLDLEARGEANSSQDHNKAVREKGV